MIMYTENWNTILNSQVYLLKMFQVIKVELMLEICMTSSLIPKEFFWINDSTVYIKRINNDWDNILKCHPHLNNQKFHIF